MPRSSARLTFAVLATGAGVFSMLQSLIAPALPTVQHALHTSQSTTTWVMTAYLLSASIFTPILGRVGDLIGKKRTLVAVLGTLTLGCLIAALAPHDRRPHRRPGDPGHRRRLFPLSFGIIRDEFAAEEVSPSISNLSAVIAAGGGVGMVAAGPDRHRARLPLAVLAARRHRRRHRADRPALHPRIPRPAPPDTSTGSAPCCCRAGWSRCCCR